MTQRFCGLTLVATELLLMQGMRLYVAGKRPRGSNRTHKDSEGDPETFLHDLTNLLPEKTARSKSGRATTGLASCQSQIPDSLLLTHPRLVEHLGNGGTYFWCELAVYVERPGMVPSLPALYPVLLGRLVVAHSEDRHQWAAELMGEGLLDPEPSLTRVAGLMPRTRAAAPLRPASTTVEDGSIVRRGAMPAGADSHAMLSLPDESLGEFSASVAYSLTDRYVMPRVYRGARGSGRHAAVPGFSIGCTAVSDPFARATMVASLPT